LAAGKASQIGGVPSTACDHTIRWCCQRNFHADYGRWLDLFSDEQINMIKNSPLDDTSVGVALRLRFKLEKCLDRLLADIMEAHFCWAIEPKLVK
jgi:hypothetical protein